MSGLCGIIHFDGKPIEIKDIEKMCKCMKNRGSDATGIWVDGSVGMGHKMLWTTPESLYEKQPLVSKDSKLTIVADARIDNRDELFEKLAIKEDEFDVVTDIDLILWSYEKWGKECPQYLIGDFSFLIWNQEKKELFAAKDKMGMKPLYYYYDDEVFLFASEVFVLRTLLNDKAEKREGSIRNWIKYRAIDYEDTFFENIRRLPFAAILSCNKNDIVIEKYWQPQEMKISYDISYEEACSRLKELFEQAVKARLRSNYPIGCELSGGLDSSSVLCVAAQTKEGKDILPFSIRFGEMSCDEGKFIKSVEDKIGKSSNMLDANAMDINGIYSFESYYTQLADWPLWGSYLPHAALADQVQNRGVRILLTGQGGDDIAQGNVYSMLDDLKRLKFWDVWRTIQYTHDKKHLLRLCILRLLPDKAIEILRNIKHKKNPFKKNSIADKRGFFNLGNSPDLFSDFALGEDASFIWSAENSHWMESNPYQHLGQKDIEVWHPFYDIRLVEFMLQLPPKYKYNEGIHKRILRDAMRGILPDLVRKRSDKAEFSQSVREQFPKNLLRKNVTEFTLVQEDFLSEEELQKVIDIYHSGKNDSMVNNSLILNCEIWYNKNI